MCQVLGASRSGYYDWCRRQDQEPSGRAAHDELLLAEIRQINLRFRYYGYPRIHEELRDRGHHVGRHRVARLMRSHGIRACRGRVRLRARSVPPARRPELVDVVRRDFHADIPNRLWFTDITQIRTNQGWLYAAVILDAFNRQVISWATEDLDRPHTAKRAFVEAVVNRRPAKGCVIHSDRGYQFTAKDWIDYATDHDLVVSIGEHGNPHDNAVMAPTRSRLAVKDRASPVRCAAPAASLTASLARSGGHTAHNGGLRRAVALRGHPFPGGMWALP